MVDVPPPLESFYSTFKIQGQTTRRSQPSPGEGKQGRGASQAQVRANKAAAAQRYCGPGWRRASEFRSSPAKPATGHDNGKPRELVSSALDTSQSGEYLR
jgi:hypothetical protein